MTAIAWAALGIAALAVSGLIGFGIAALAARKDAGEQRARADVLAVRLEVANANTKSQSARADFEKGRADALDAAIVRAVADGPIDGSYDRLLQARHDAAASAAGGGDAAGVRDGGDPGEPASTIGPDDLLPPGT